MLCNMYVCILDRNLLLKEQNSEYFSRNVNSKQFKLLYSKNYIYLF